MDAISNVANVVEILFGIFFLIGAIFNISYTYRHGEEFFGSFAANAWLRPVRTLIQNIVIPHTKIFTILLVVFMAAVGIMILTRGSLVIAGLVAGAVFSLAAVIVSSIRGAIANLILAAVLVLLALVN